MYSSANVVHSIKINDTVTVEELNEKVYHELHIPAVVFVALCIVVGVIGNLLVLVIYKTRFRQSNHRYFILFIGSVDLLACLTGMPFLIASLRLPYMMTSSIACKVIRSIHYALNNSSGLLLVVISIERYRKICRPFRKQFSPRQTLYLCIATVTFSVLVAVPAAVFYGNNTIHTGIGNITGTQCYVADEILGKKYFELYNAALLMETVICIVIFAILYTFIIRKLWASDQFIATMRSINKQGTEHGKNTLTHSGLEPNSIDDSVDSRIDSVYERGSIIFNKGKFNSQISNSSNDSNSGPVVLRTSRSISNPNISIIKQLNESLTGDSRDNGEASESVYDNNETCSKQTSVSIDYRDAVKNGSRNGHDKNETNRPNSKHRMSLAVPQQNLVTKDNRDFRRSWNDVTDSDPSLVKRPGLARSLSPAQKQVYEHLLAKQTLEKRETSTSSSKRKSSKTTARVTVMLFTVTLVFVLAFVPHLTLMLLTIEVADFLDSMSPSELMVYHVFLRIFIINNIANPVIYFIFDTKFRTLCKSSFYNCRTCKK